MSDDNLRLPPARPFLLESTLTTSLHFAGNEIQSQMWKHAPDALALEYTQTMMGFMLFNVAPQHIAMVGLGGGSLAKFCHRHLPGSNIVVVEINAQVAEVVQENGQDIVTVRFTGLIRETPESGADPFHELWHLVRPATGGDWAIAGITPVQ